MGGRPFTHALLSVVFHRRPARLVQGKGAGLLPSTSGRSRDAAQSAGCGASPSGWYGWGLPGLKEARMARLPGGMCTALGPVPPPEPQLSLLITSTITAQRARALNDAAMRLASSATSRARWDDVLSPISHLPYRTSGAFQRRFPPGGSGWDNSQCSATSWTAAWIHDISPTGRSRSPERQRDHHRRFGAPHARRGHRGRARLRLSQRTRLAVAGSAARGWELCTIHALVQHAVCERGHWTRRPRSPVDESAQSPESSIGGCLTWQVSRASCSRSGRRPGRGRRGGASPFVRIGR